MRKIEGWIPLHAGQPAMSIFLPDAFGTFVEINPQFLCYRNRVIDVSSISTYQTKSRKVTVNTFKQNSSLPTMCIWFKTTDEAKSALATMTRVLYGVESECPPPQENPEPCEEPLTKQRSDPMDFTGLWVAGGIYTLMILAFNLAYLVSRSSSNDSSAEL